MQAQGMKLLCIRHKNARQTKSVQRQILKLSLQNLQYANDGPLLLAVIPGGRVQEDKNLAGSLFAGGSIFFFRINCRNFRRADKDAFFCKNTEEYGRLAALYDVGGSYDVIMM